MSDASVILSQISVTPAAGDMPAPASQAAPNGAFAGVLAAQMPGQASQAGIKEGSGLVLPGEGLAPPTYCPPGEGLPPTGNTLPPGLLPGMDPDGKTDTAATQPLYPSQPLAQVLVETSAGDSEGETLTPVETLSSSTPLTDSTQELSDAMPPLLDPLSPQNPQTSLKMDTDLPVMATPHQPADKPGAQSIGLGLKVSTGFQANQPASPTDMVSTVAKGTQPDANAVVAPLPLGIEARLAKAMRPGISHSVTGSLGERVSETKAGMGGENPLQLLTAAKAMNQAAVVPTVPQGRSASPAAEKVLSTISAASPDKSGVESSFWGTLTSVSQPGTSNSTNGVPQLAINTPAHNANWSQELGQRVTWMANRELREAQIHMNPRHLGPIDVRISYGHDQQMSVNFVAHHAQTRDAIDAALPRLREMFESQGLNLADANVSEESYSNREQQFLSKGHDTEGRRAEGVRISNIDDINEEDRHQMASNSVAIEGIFSAYA
jgi:flagellar hook-length control protein FliK